MQSSLNLKIRLDNPFNPGTLDSKEFSVRPISPVLLLNSVNSAIRGNLWVLGFLNQTAEDCSPAWKKLHEELSTEEKTQCKLLAEKFQQLQSIIEKMQDDIAKDTSDLAKVFDQGCKDFYAVLAQTQPLEKEFSHIELDSHRLTFLIKNMFALRQHLNQTEHKSTLDKKDPGNFCRFFQKPVAEMKPPYAIPEQIQEIWMGSKLPREYKTKNHFVAKRAKNCGMNLWSYDDNVWGDGLVPVEVYNEKEQKTENLLMDLAVSPRQHVRNIRKELYPKIKEIFTPAMAKEIFSIIDLESEGLKNYATVSDLLRYIILLMEGGWYLDTDLEVKTHFEAKEDNDYIFNEIQKVLTEEEYHIFLLANDSDFRDVIQPADSKNKISFESVVNKLRNILYLEPLHRLHDFFDEDELKAIATQFGPSIWQQLDAGQSTDAFDKIYFKKFIPKLIYQLMKQLDDPALEQMKKNGFSPDNQKKEYTTAEIDRFQACFEKFKPGLFEQAQKPFKVNLWSHILYFLKSINYSFKHPDPQIGLYHGDDINCFIGVVPNHHSLYQTLQKFIQTYENLKYEMALDYFMLLLACDSEQVKDPERIAQLSHYSLMDIKRCKRSLVFSEQHVAHLQKHQIFTLHRRELTIQLGVCALTRTGGRDKKILSYNKFGINVICDKTWLGKEKAKSFDTTDCRRLSF